MNFSERDSKLLSLWQSLHFEAESNDSSPSRKADDLRGLLNQISHLHSSGVVSREGYSRLSRQYADKYCGFVDGQDTNSGLNNFAEPVLALVTGHRNDSPNWESSLTLDAFKNSKVWKDVIKRNQELELSKNTQNQSPHFSEDSMVTEVSSSDNSWKDNLTNQRNSKLDPNAETSKQNPPAIMEKTGHDTEENITSSNKRKWNFVYSNDSTTTRQPLHGNIAGTSKSTLHGQTQGPNPSYNKAFPSKDNANTSMQPIKEQGQNLFTRKDDGEDFQEQSKPSKFITAKHKYIIDCKTKNERGGGHQANRGVGDDRQKTSSGNGYGALSRRTLGTRRGPSSKFVPPVPRNNSDDEVMENTSMTRKRGFDKNSGDMDDGMEPEIDERLKNIEPKMVELIMNEIMDHGPPITWDDIAGLEFAKNVIKEIVVWPMLRPDIFKGLRGPPKGLLLFGPPGTGKTLIGKCIASQSKATFFSISASSLTSKWVGEGEKMVRALFAVARCHLPAVIFIDEIDSLLTQRSDGEHEASRRIKTEFLVQLDGATTNTDERLLVVGATNRPQEIDEAARRRLVKRLYIPLPDGGARHQIIQNLLSQQNYNLTEQDISKIVTRTEGYSGSDMSNLCREAAIGPIRCIATSDIEHITADQVRPIEYTDFDAALSQVRASVSQKDLDTYIQWNTLYGSGSK
ncbi:fidgetin-like protein 1 isoform X2 [Actinia tenebrosa]|uniref:Fidgetin-like protein 1 n=1 Tax=Actinia tenebrosa TaxID=6105 RepID=A0A6P8J9G1_ACTTE|nr:fidgetin-like protein 1 isoform X2 [Actinia tenebrosa]